jgi:hypothetical protein
MERRILIRPLLRDSPLTGLPTPVDTADGRLDVDL